MNQPSQTPEAAVAPEPPPAWRSLEAAVAGLVLVALLLHPTQFTVRHCAQAVAGVLTPLRPLAGRVPAVNVTISDVLILLAFGPWLALRWRQGRLLERLRLFPPSLAVLLVCALLSLAPFLKSTPAWETGPVVDYGRGMKQMIQLCLFFVCAYLMLVDYLSDSRWRRRLILAVAAAACVTVLVGLTEYLRLRPPSPEALRSGALISPMDVDATFGFRGEAAGAHEVVGAASDRNVLGAWLTLALPLVWAVFLFGPRSSLRWALLALGAVAAVLLLHAGLWAAALAGVLALSCLKGRVCFAATAVGMLVLYGALFSLGPQRHGVILLDSVMLRRTTDSFRTLPVYGPDPELDQSGRGADLTRAPYDYPWQQRYVEWQPALLAAARNPLFGMGVGNYQSRINRFYSDRDFSAYTMPKAARNLMEQGGNAFYAVWLAETGFVGLLAFAWVMLSFLRRGAVGSRAEPDALWRALKLGSCASLGAAALGCMFTDYWVRGVGIAFVFVLAIAATPPSQGEETQEAAGQGS